MIITVNRDIMYDEDRCLIGHTVCLCLRFLWIYTEPHMWAPIESYRDMLWVMMQCVCVYVFQTAGPVSAGEGEKASVRPSQSRETQAN